MRLQGRNAVVYGAASDSGAAAAIALAVEGATVFLAGRAKDRLDGVARDIAKLGGVAKVSNVDALHPKSVEDHLGRIVSEYGSLDLSVNLAYLSVDLDGRLTALSDQEFASGAFTRARSNFITGTAAAREMAYQGRGSILATAPPSGDVPKARSGSIAVGNAAIESFYEQLDLEVGPRGVHVAYLRPVGAPVDALMAEILGRGSPTERAPALPGLRSGHAAPKMPLPRIHLPLAAVA